MRKWKKGCAGLLTAAMAIGMIAPGAAETVDAAASDTVVPTPKFELSMDETLETTGLTIKKVVSGAWGSAMTEYSGTEQYVEDAIEGKSLYLNGEYGLLLDGTNLADEYTVSFWAKPVESLGEHSPLFGISAQENGAGNWLILAGSNSSSDYKLWQGAEGINNYEIGRITYAVNEWKQYTMSYKNGVVALYEDGEAKMQQTLQSTKGLSENPLLMLGVNNWDAEPKCYIDEVKIYNEALDAAQAKLLYKGVEVTADTQEVRVGKSITLDSVALEKYNDCTIEWVSDNTGIATVENGVVTGQSKGTATITANWMKDNEVVASDNIAINVLQENGQLIADFTFDDDETGFSGAGATAEKNGDISITDRDGANGKALVLNGAGAWLNVVGENNASLLTGLEEFTVSYDSYSEGDGGAWSFFAAPNANSLVYGNEYYIGLLDRTNVLRAEHYYVGRTEPASGSIEVNAPAGWKHVDLVQREGSIELYIDKVKVASKDVTSTVSDILGDNSIVQIGKGNWGYGEYFKGMLDNYKIYNYALTAEEVASEPIDTMTITGDTQVKLGNTLQLNANISPEAAIYENLAWASYDDAVATVDQNGLVTPITEGTTTITVSAQDKEGVKSAEIEITVLPQTYTVTVNGGTLVGDQTEFRPMEQARIKADTPEEGKKFAYWTNEENQIIGYDSDYTFYVTKDMVVTANYTDVAEPVEESVLISCTSAFDASTGKVKVTVKRILPVGYTVVEHGILATKNDTIGADTATDNPALFNKDAASGVSKVRKVGGSINGTATVNVKISSGTCYARGYVVYKDADGNEGVAYSEVSSYAINQ